MIRVAELIYIVPEERAEFIENALNPSDEVKRILWLHGIKNQFYFEVNGYLLMTFEYAGSNLQLDMQELSKFSQVKSILVPTRRKDVPEAELETTNWWAPIKRLGSILHENPIPDDEDEKFSMQEMYRSMMNGHMHGAGFETGEIAFDEDEWDDWGESTHF